MANPVADQREDKDPLPLQPWHGGVTDPQVSTKSLTAISTGTLPQLLVGWSARARLTWCGHAVLRGGGPAPARQLVCE